MPLHIRSARDAAAAAVIVWSASAQAATDPTGVWFDHNGRGAVEIKQCAGGTGLCGYVVNVKDPANASRCGLQILGEVTQDGGGWIYSPERKQKYDVALKRLSDDKLRVVGNAGSRYFSKTFTWNRAPDDIVRCDGKTAAAPASSTEPAPAAEVAPRTGKTAETAPAPAAAVTTGSRTGSAALIATTPAKSSPETGQAAGSATAPTAESKLKKVISAELDAATAGSGSKRTCTYRIPYIGRTVSVPCRE